MLMKFNGGRMGPDGSPKVGKINFGDFGRLKPISPDWGFQRGGPVDRYYIENFLRKNSSLIKGRALEVKDDDYLRKFGSQVTKYEILDVDKDNPKATIIADLASADNVPSNAYDCIVLTQVLQLIYDLRSTIKHLHRSLKPGGVLLITVPGITHFIHEIYHPYWCWAFTEKSVRMLLEEEFEKENITIETHGNVLTAASFLHGVGAGELTKEQYDHVDRDYQLVITAKAVKKG